jgi:hypothetical protein
MVHSSIRALCRDWLLQVGQRSQHGAVFPLLRIPRQPLSPGRLISHGLFRPLLPPFHLRFSSECSTLCYHAQGTQHAHIQFRLSASMTDNVPVGCPICGLVLALAGLSSQFMLGNPRTEDARALISHQLGIGGRQPLVPSSAYHPKDTSR